jgi:hypothetical protein
MPSSFCFLRQESIALDFYMIPSYSAFWNPNQPASKHPQKFIGLLHHIWIILGILQFLKKRFLGTHFHA